MLHRVNPLNKWRPNEDADNESENAKSDDIANFHHFLPAALMEGIGYFISS